MKKNNNNNKTGNAREKGRESRKIDVLMLRHIANLLRLKSKFPHMKSHGCFVMYVMCLSRAQIYRSFIIEWLLAHSLSVSTIFHLLFLFSSSCVLFVFVFCFWFLLCTNKFRHPFAIVFIQKPLITFLASYKAVELHFVIRFEIRSVVFFCISTSFSKWLLHCNTHTNTNHERAFFRLARNELKNDSRTERNEKKFIHTWNATAIPVSLLLDLLTSSPDLFISIKWVNWKWNMPTAPHVICDVMWIAAILFRLYGSSLSIWQRSH